MGTQVTITKRIGRTPGVYRDAYSSCAYLLVRYLELGAGSVVKSGPAHTIAPRVSGDTDPNGRILPLEYHRSTPANECEFIEGVSLRDPVVHCLVASFAKHLIDINNCSWV